MDAGDSASDSEWGRFHSCYVCSKLGQSTLAGGTQGDIAQSGAKTLSTHLCNSLSSPDDEWVLLQSQAKGKMS